MEFTVDNFKHFALNNPFETTVEYCEQLVEALNIEADELGNLLVDKHGTIYCGVADIATKFGFCGEDDLTGDIRELMGDEYLERGLTCDKAYDHVAKQLHGLAEGSFWDNEFSFVDLGEVEKHINWPSK